MSIASGDRATWACLTVVSAAGGERRKDKAVRQRLETAIEEGRVEGAEGEPSEREHAPSAGAGLSTSSRQASTSVRKRAGERVGASREGGGMQGA